MTFAHPLAFVLLLLAIAIVRLCRRQVALPRETVATALFWEQVFAEERARSQWQPWRHGASLAGQLVVLALLVLALAGPQMPPPRQTVLVLDNSADMAAAKEAAARRIAAMHDYDRMAIVSAGDEPMPLCTLTSDQDILREALQAAAPARQPARMPAALDLARGMLEGAARGQVVDLGSPTDAAGETSQIGGPPGPPLWLYPAGLALLLLTVQWCLYQRRWLV